ncbi:hypothetical protein [Methylocystis echinoides]|jgi:hypothetical protein|uniref:hypothetical protein n=1 Tax=Methylocystis echinoides TaxID=29468 RepID=UPI00342FFDE4
MQNQKRGVALFLLILLAGPNIAFGDVLIATTTGAQSISVTDVNGVVRATVNGVPVATPYNRHGTIIKIVPGGKITMPSSSWRAREMDSGR